MKPDMDQLFELLASGPFLRPPEVPLAGHWHLDEARLWALAGYDGGQISAAEREDWAEVQRCSDCFNAVMNLRFGIRSSPPVEISYVRLRQALDFTTVQLALSWVGAALRLRRAFPSGRRVMRTLDLELPSSSIQTTVGPYAVSVDVAGWDARGQTWTLLVKIYPPPTSSLRLCLYRDGALVAEESVPDSGEVAFNALAPASHTLELGRADGTSLGAIRFTAPDASL